MPALFGFGDNQEFDIISKMNSRQLDDFYADTATNDDWCCDSYNDLSSLILLEHNDFSSLLKNSLNTNTPSEDIWKKFELLDNISDDSSNSSSSNSSSSCSMSDDSDNLNQKLSCSIESSSREIRHHDCMWAGRCSSEEHGDSESTMSISSSPLMDIKIPVHQIKPINSRSLLVQRVNQQQRTVILSSPSFSKSCAGLRTYEAKLAVSKHVRDRMNNSMKHVLLDSEGEDPRPDTPVSEFDVHSPFHQHFGSNSDDSEDDYSDDNSDDRDSHSRQVKCDGFYNDHSYHIVKPTIKTENLGVQTPSDSEEEIDVVSLGEAVCAPSALLPLQHRPGAPPLLIATKPVIIRSTRCPTNLPTNPSPSDKQHLQHSIALAAKRTGGVPPIRIRIDQASLKRRRVVPKEQPKEEEEEEEESSSEEEEQEEEEEVACSSARGGRRGKPKAHRRANYDSSSSSSPRKRGSGSDSEDSSGKRTMHNTMERQRRVDLRNAFEGLRNLIPKLCDVEKAPKVNILKEAGLYCRALQNGETAMNRKMEDLRRKQSQLRNRVSQLRRSLAAHR